jgi:hypothetical protein
LTISNGGTVSTYQLGISAYDGSSSQANVDDPNSALNVRTTLYVGGADLGDPLIPGGVGLLEISTGGVVTTESTTVFGQPGRGHHSLSSCGQMRDQVNSD